MAISTDLSIIVTAHAEGILLHRTLKSVLRATKLLNKNHISWELIIHVDKGSHETLAYIDDNQNFLNAFAVYYNSFGDLGTSRNFAVGKAVGKYVALIDADDLMSENWLLCAVEFLKQQSTPTVAHSEVTVEFEGADSLILKHGETDHTTDTLLSVYANRWNSVIVAPRDLLLEEPYTANTTGYGYEDWHLNCRLIARGVHNRLIPHTAIFVRRKKTNSEWLRQIQSAAVLRANPLLSLQAVRSLNTNPFSAHLPHLRQENPRDLKLTIKRVLQKYPLVHRSALRIHTTLKRQRLKTTNPIHIPSWLQEEWLELHKIERQIFPTYNLVHHIPIYDTLTDDHKRAGALYKAVVDKLHHNTYDYLIFVPWLMRGGADRYAINYANTIAALVPDKHVLVVSTLPVVSPWSELLDDSVDFLNFGTLANTVSSEIKHRVLGHLIENGNVGAIHIINSELGYDFVSLHKAYLKATGRKVIVSSFSQSIDTNGRLYGYSHTHVPLIYDVAALITSDNQTVTDMWVNDYGFSRDKLVIHRQPIELPSSAPTHNTPHDPLRVLWAARIAPEKQPGLVSQIGIEAGNAITIDMYGSIEEGCETYTHSLPHNVTYCGVFDGFSSLPTRDYDVLLYTSMFDGMPNTLLEAASHQLPIVSSAVGGIPEFVEDRKTGMLIRDITDPSAYASILTELARNKELLATLSQNAYTKLQQEFSTELYRHNVKKMLSKLGY